PGSTKDLSGWRSFWQRSRSCSSAVTSPAPTRNMPGWNASGGVASSPPRSKSSFCRRRRMSSSSRAFAARGVLALTARAAPLVDRAVRVDPCAVLRDARAADEIGLAAIAATGVDARDADRHGALRPGEQRLDAGRARLRTGEGQVLGGVLAAAHADERGGDAG